MKKPSINPDFFDFLRLRNVYDLHLEQLTVEPGDTPPAGETVEVQPLTDETTKIDKNLVNEAVAAFHGQKRPTS